MCWKLPRLMLSYPAALGNVKTGGSPKWKCVATRGMVSSRRAAAPPLHVTVLARRVLQMVAVVVDTSKDLPPGVSGSWLSLG